MKTYLLFAIIFVIHINLISQTRIYPSIRAQIETPIAINPTNSSNLIGTAITIVSSNFARIGCYYSLNGGASWQGSEEFSMDVSAGDPVIAFDPDGIAYIVFQVYSEAKLYMRKSTDGGVTWIPQLGMSASNIISLSSGAHLDKPWLAISPIRNSNGYFNIYISFTMIPSQGKMEIRLYRSTNGGASFQSIKGFNLSNYHYFGSYVEVGPDGEVLLAWAKAELIRNKVIGIIVVRSTDQGINFQNDVEVPVIQIGSYGSSGYFIKDSNIPADCYPRIAVDRSPFSRGTAYVVWTTRSVEGGDPNIRMLKGSISGGQFNWNTNIITIDGSTGEQWMPAVNVNPDGVLSVLYYSSGSNLSDPIYTKLRYSTNGGSGFTEINVGSLNGFTIPTITFLGDYHGLASWFGKTYNFWCEYKSDPNYDERQVYFRSLDIPILSTPTNYVKTIVDQKDVANQSFDKFSRWNQGLFTNYTPPFQFLFQTSTNEVIRAKQDFKSGTTQKYHKWEQDNDVVNHRIFPIQTGLTSIVSQFQTSQKNISVGNYFLEYPTFNPSNDKIWFRDPWYIDFTDGYGDRNRGMSGAIFHEKDSPINFAQAELSDYLGIFLDQTISSGNNYLVRSPIQQPEDIFLPQTGRYHKFYFYNWSSSGTDPLTQDNIVNGYYETPVVFRSGSATVTANLKGTELSNDVNAFANNSQKKLVQTTDGRLHKVYSSMGYVWYEKSTDNGTTWTIENDGKPLSSNEAKLPAIDYYGSEIIIVWQEKYNFGGIETYKIRLAYYQRPGSFLVFHDVYDESYSAIPETYSSNTAPVISWANDYLHRLIVVWKTHNDAFLYRYGSTDCYSPLTWYNSGDEDWITGTDENSVNPSIATRKDGGATVFHLGWQQSTSAINYCTLTPDENEIIRISSVETPSSGDGFSYKINPSISIKYDGYPTLVYVGSLYQSATTQVTKRSRSSSSWGTFAKYGANVNSPTEYNSIIVWSEGNANKLYRPWSSIRTLSTYGQYVQMSNGGSSMYAIAFKQYSLPSYFQTSPNLLTFPKVNSLINECGREGIVAKGEAEFYFILGDVIVDNEVINFPEVEDTTNITNANKLNLYMKSNSFSINESSEFSFSIAYGAVDSLKALNELTGESRIQFSLELIDASTNEIIGELDDIILDAANIYTCQIQSYQVNTQNLGNRIVKLRVTTSTDFDGAYYLADILTEEEVLGKRDFEELNFSGESIVTSYDMFQNYPNPFNPATTIKYQIPHSGDVTLKVFDILGSEVATLVNEAQKEGKYDINFDASKLSSGVYLYMIQVNDFVSSKKMILLK